MPSTSTTVIRDESLFANDLDAPPGLPKIVRTGTWAFQSVELQMNITNSIEHQRYHDLESFYHVICWVSLRHARHGLDGTSLLDILRQIFDCAVKVNGTVRASYTKKSYMRANDLTHETEFQNEPLACLLRALGRKFRHLYITGPKPRDEDSERAQALYAEDVKEHEEALKKLKLDRDPMWAEALVMEAIRQPDSKWGDISHYCHTLPPSRQHANFPPPPPPSTADVVQNGDHDHNKHVDEDDDPAHRLLGEDEMDGDAQGVDCINGIKQGQEEEGAEEEEEEEEEEERPTTRRKLSH